MTPTHVDVAVVGGGAAGLFAAARAAELGARVAVFDHAPVLGEKIRISGGGRCNFTNRDCSPANFLSQDPRFVRHALAAFPPEAFIERVRQRGIGFHEKHRGQLFCDHSAQDIVAMLLDDCRVHGVVLAHPVEVLDCAPPTAGQPARLETSRGVVIARRLIVATGGLPVPKIGATAWALDFARRLGLSVVEPRPALVPLALTDPASEPLRALSGVSAPVQISAVSRDGYGEGHFDEDLLLTHKGLSGPAVLQASSFWEEGAELWVDWLPDAAFDESAVGRSTVGQMLEARLPSRLAAALMEHIDPEIRPRRWAELGRQARTQVRSQLQRVPFRPAATLGWNKAEVMRGGVATEGLSPKTCEVRAHPGVYFIGECVDVTGHLGGHNFQWAWASGFVAGRHAGSSSASRPGSSSSAC